MFWLPVHSEKEKKKNLDVQYKRINWIEGRNRKTKPDQRNKEVVQHKIIHWRQKNCMSLTKLIKFSLSILTQGTQMY